MTASGDGIGPTVGPAPGCCARTSKPHAPALPESCLPADTLCGRHHRLSGGLFVFQNSIPMLHPSGPRRPRSTFCVCGHAITLSACPFSAEIGQSCPLRRTGATPGRCGSKCLESQFISPSSGALTAPMDDG